MTPVEFVKIRKALAKTQKGIAAVLGVSLKAIHSYEQGWRSIPAHVERQMIFLRVCQSRGWQKGKQCWTIKKCPMDVRKKCPAWELHCGRLCWFINGTLCGGEVQEDWAHKMEICRSCEVLKDYLDLCT